MIFGDLDSTRVTFFTKWLDSSQSHFYKISEALMYKPSLFAHKEKGSSCFSNDQDGAIVLFRLFSRVMLHFEDQVFPSIAGEDLRLCFSLKGH